MILFQFQRLTSDEEQILGLQQLDVDPAETVKERLGEPLAAPSLLQGVLRCKQVEGGWTLERLSKLWYEDLSSVVQHSIEALQHTLPGQIQLVQQHPMSSFDGS